MTARSRRSARLEAIFWIAGLVLVAVADPTRAPSLTVCPLAHLGEMLGFAICPGCGLGRAVAWLARGDLAASFSMHPLAIPAVGILVYHAARLWHGSRALPTPIVH